MTQQNTAFSTSKIRTFDPQRYWCSLFAKNSDQQQDLLVLLQLHHELSRIRYITNETQLGIIRLKWWDDAISMLYKNEPLPYTHQTPITHLLQRTLEKISPPKALFHDCVLGFERSFNTPICSNEAELETIIQHQIGCLHLLYLHFANIHEPAIHKATAHFSTAWGIALKATYAGNDLKNGICYLPETLLEKQELSLDHLGSTAWQEKSPTIINSLCDLAQKHIDLGREQLQNHHQNELKPAAPVLLVGFLAELMVKQLHKIDYRALTKQRNLTPSIVLPRMWWRATRGNY